MEYQKISNEPHSSLIINKVESGMPRWLIEVGFIMKIIQAVSTSIDLCNWIETNGMVIPRAIVFLHHPVGLPIRQQNTDSTGYQKGKNTAVIRIVLPVIIRQFVRKGILFFPNKPLKRQEKAKNVVPEISFCSQKAKSLPRAASCPVLSEKSQRQVLEARFHQKPVP